MADDAATPPSNMRWFTGGCTVLLFLCLGAGAVAWWHVSGLLKPFNPLVNRQFELMVKGDWPAAYDLMAPEYQQKLTLDDFKTRYSKHPWLQREPTFVAQALRYDSKVGWELRGKVFFHDTPDGEAVYRMKLGGKIELDRILDFDWK